MIHPTPIVKLGIAGIGISTALFLADTLHVAIPGTVGLPSWFAGLTVGAGGVLWVWRQVRDLRLGPVASTNGHTRAVEHLRRDVEREFRDLGERLAKLETHRENIREDIAQMRDQTQQAIADIVERLRDVVARGLR